MLEIFTLPAGADTRPAGGDEVHKKEIWLIQPLVGPLKALHDFVKPVSYLPVSSR
jgi:hypothetical protein